MSSNPDLIALAAGLCLLASAFFSGTETGLMSVSRIRLRSRPEAETAALRRLLVRVEDPILTCLIGTNLTNVLGSALVTSALTLRYGPRGDVIAAVLMSTLIILFGEILPKLLYREYPERLTLASTSALRGAMVTLAPVRAVLLAYSRLLQAVLPGGGDGADRDANRDAVAALLRTQHGRTGDRSYRELLARTLQLDDLNLGVIMTPAARMVSLSRGDSLTACRATAAVSGFSRLPVIDADPRRPVGWVLARDLLFLDEDAPWRGIPPRAIRTCPWVRRDLSPWDLFEEMRWQQQQIAMVADEDGNLVGLVTLEDLLEVLVGSIEDEFDRSWREETRAKSPSKETTKDAR
ncbi:MAG TPA: CNNM domain-containing protein [Candidatus Krumholzibacteria bacterium]|nr:CNNM domain-containing protein [Candidatus Krumholzibacteria bacterium]HRX50224.1 CNNM domain-containing protein [Candidatus Krumholzibacteria bacterium]